MLLQNISYIVIASFSHSFNDVCFWQGLPGAPGPPGDAGIIGYGVCMFVRVTFPV